MTRPILYLLDTNICVYTMNQHPEQVIRKVTDVTEAGHMLGITTVTLHELWFGVHNSGRIAFNTRRLQDLVNALDVYPFDDAAAEVSAELRAGLKAKGTPIGGYDVMIAGHALSLDAVLVTNNTREFSRVTGLRLEDWT